VWSSLSSRPIAFAQAPPIFIGFLDETVGIAEVQKISISVVNTSHANGVLDRTPELLGLAVGQANASRRAGRPATALITINEERCSRL